MSQWKHCTFDYLSASSAVSSASSTSSLSSSSSSSSFIREENLLTLLQSCNSSTNSDNVTHNRKKTLHRPKSAVWWTSSHWLFDVAKTKSCMTLCWRDQLTASAWLPVQHACSPDLRDYCCHPSLWPSPALCLPTQYTWKDDQVALTCAAGYVQIWYSMNSHQSKL